MARLLLNFSQGKISWSLDVGGWVKRGGVCIRGGVGGVTVKNGRSEWNGRMVVAPTNRFLIFIFLNAHLAGACALPLLVR